LRTLLRRSLHNSSSPAANFSRTAALPMHTGVMLHSAPQLKLPRVLLIDDDLISREVVATVLTLSGHTVHTADSGAAALELLASGTCAPGAILMDAQMPGLSGARLLAELRARSRAVIVVISATPPNGLSDGVVAAADGFLLKPFGAEALQNLIEERRSRVVSSPESLLNDGQPVVSTKTLAQLRGMMPEVAVREIYAATVADLEKRLSALETAIATGDIAEVRRIGHAIKGGCGMAGALQAARIGALIETAPPRSEGNQFDSYFVLFRDLRAATRNLEDMLETEFPARARLGPK